MRHSWYARVQDERLEAARLGDAVGAHGQAGGDDHVDQAIPLRARAQARRDRREDRDVREQRHQAVEARVGAPDALPRRDREQRRQERSRPRRARPRGAAVCRASARARAPALPRSVPRSGARGRPRPRVPPAGAGAPSCRARTDGPSGCRRRRGRAPRRGASRPRRSRRRSAARAARRRCADPRPSSSPASPRGQDYSIQPLESPVMASDSDSRHAVRRLPRRPARRPRPSARTCSRGRSGCRRCSSACARCATSSCWRPAPSRRSPASWARPTTGACVARDAAGERRLLPDAADAARPRPGRRSGRTARSRCATRATSRSR